MTAEVTDTTDLLTELNAVVAALPPERVRQVLNFAKLLKLSRTGTIEMGELTPEDKRAIAHAALRRFEEQHPGEDWSHLRAITTPGYK